MLDERYLIGNRFVLRKVGGKSEFLSPRFQIVDLKGELYDILGKFGCNPLEKFGYKSLAGIEYKTLEELLEVKIRGAYFDGRDLYCVLRTEIGSYEWVFAIKGDEILAYGVSTNEQTFYMNYYGKEIRGRVAPSEEFYFKRNGGELEIGFKGVIILNYFPFNRKLTPVIKVLTIKSECAVLPELDKTYNGRFVRLKIMGKGLLVSEWTKNGRERVYMLMPEGEALIYRHVGIGLGETVKFDKVGNVIIVKYNRSVEESLKKGLLRYPNFNYLFLRFYLDADEEGKSMTFTDISFDMENWTRVKASKMVYGKSWEKVQEPFQYARKVPLDEVEAKYNKYWKVYKERELEQLSI